MTLTGPLPSDSYFALWDGKSSLAEYLINLEVAELIKREDEEQEIKKDNIRKQVKELQKLISKLSPIEFNNKIRLSNKRSHRF